MGLRHVMVPAVIQLMEAIIGDVQPLVYINIELAFFTEINVPNT